jgi:hypothetical protein
VQRNISKLGDKREVPSGSGRKTKSWRPVMKRKSQERSTFVVCLDIIGCIYLKLEPDSIVLFLFYSNDDGVEMGGTRENVACKLIWEEE